MGFMVGKSEIWATYLHKTRYISLRRSPRRLYVAITLCNSTANWRKIGVNWCK